MRSTTPPSRRQLLAAGLVLAFLAIDIVWIRFRLPHSLFGDEWRYVYYANNLLHGFFSPRDRVFLFNGPGYPLFLLPFVKADWLDGARYANAFLHAGALAYAWCVLPAGIPLRLALAAVAFLGVYGPVHAHTPLLYTEVLVFFLTTAWVFHSLEAPTSLAHRLAAGLYLGFLCLTKVVFGVVLTAFIAVLLVAWLRRRSRLLTSYLQQAALAALLCVPWLTYTYRLTGRPLYWSSGSGTAFYWLTSPYPDEWGDWYHQGWVHQNPILRAHHGAIIDEMAGLARNPQLSVQEQVFNLSTPESADIFLRQGRKNIREHPLKFFRNWCGNMVRIFLDVPTTVRGTPFFNVYSISNLPLLGWTAFVAIVAWRRRVPPPASWIPIAAFALLSIGAYSFSSAVGRYLMPLVPLWLLGTCLTWNPDRVPDLPRWNSGG
jgi:4-amino-4-deoxy-L-arabinose transferase-like glycosyltransferase